MLRLLERAGEQRVALPSLTSTDYVNTIPTDLEPWFPGDEDVERRYRAWIRWNAAIMAHPAQRPGVGWAAIFRPTHRLRPLTRSARPLFRGKSHPGGGDELFIQGHAAPGIPRGRFPRAGCPPINWTVSGRSTAIPAAGCRPTRTRG